MRTAVVITIMICWVSVSTGHSGAQNVLTPHVQQPLDFRFVDPDKVALRQIGEEGLDGRADFSLSRAIAVRASLLPDRPGLFDRDMVSLNWHIGGFSRATRAHGRPPEVNRPVFNSLYNPPKADEEDIVRKEWQEAFGVDVWYPYYKAKDVEDWIKERMSVRIWKLKGEPQVERTRVFYSFKSRF